MRVVISPDRSVTPVLSMNRHTESILNTTTAHKHPWVDSLPASHLITAERVSGLSVSAIRRPLKGAPLVAT